VPPNADAAAVDLLQVVTYLGDTPVVVGALLSPGSSTLSGAIGSWSAFPQLRDPVPVDDVLEINATTRSIRPGSHREPVTS
jgi:hypothetical protein